MIDWGDITKMETFDRTLQLNRVVPRAGKYNLPYNFSLTANCKIFMNFNCWPFYNATNGTIIPSVGDNINSKLCVSGSRKKKKKKIVVPIVASLGGLLILSLLVAATVLGIRIKRQDKTKGKNFNYMIHIDIN